MNLSHILEEIVDSTTVKICHSSIPQRLENHHGMDKITAKYEVLVAITMDIIRRFPVKTIM